MKDLSPILVIDDTDLMRTAYERQLKHAGLRVLLFTNGQDAIQAIKEGQKFSAVVCDWNMPGLSGDQVYTLIRSRLAGRPFVLCTGLPDEFTLKHPAIACEIIVLDKSRADFMAALVSCLTSLCPASSL